MANIFRTASIWLKIAIVCCAVGAILFIIGFSTTSWTTRKHYHTTSSFGLWQFSHCDRSRCDTASYRILNDYHRAIQAMECLGLIGFALSLATILLYMCVDSCRRRDFLQAATAFTFLGLLFACIGFAIFGSKTNAENLHRGDLGWSMGVAIGGAILYGIAGIMLIIQLVR